MKSRVELTVVVVAHNTPVQELLAYIEYLPAVIRAQLFRHMYVFRLREMELAWEADVKSEWQGPPDDYDPLSGDKFLPDRETQHTWKARLTRCHSAEYIKERSYRNMFWEDKFQHDVKAAGSAA
ncbi:hypothetical protein PsorP6_007548 [Peronosclerospora sorghi]|uniref:Uncharacterized protein n=1 Tax=Peronosclerospora sorghi TaxID=230839 RepID=A0ACC0WBZ6_9STRA|nr:hypothetical protein PsorP6_007548 [Peronosclerospora sorghi]